MFVAPATGIRSAFSLPAALFFLAAFSMGRVAAQAPSLDLSLSPEGIGVGSCGELLIEIENESASVVDQLAFRLDFPDGAALADPALAQNECDGELLISDGGTSMVLANGRIGPNTTCRIRVGVILLAEGPVVLTTSNLTSSAGSSAPASVSLDIPANAPSLGFTKEFETSPIQLGGTTTLTYFIENQSGLPAEGIVFLDDLSPGMVVAPSPNIASSCDPAVITAVPGSQEISLADGVLQPGESCRISVDVVGVATGNNASISGSIRSSFPNGNAEPSGFACAVLRVIAPEDLANLSLTKSFPDGPMAPGTEGTLRFTLTNNSRSQAYTGISFTDDLEAMLPGARAVELPTVGGLALDADFDGGGASVLGVSWDFLDRIENENGSNDDYPLDASGNEWNEEDFDVSTSTVGPWEQGDAPLQGGVIDGFPPGTPELLDGIDDAPNGENLVTTYLFRQKFNLTEAQAGISEWSMLSLFDDAAIVYVNGQEVFRSEEMPAGPVNTNTLSGLGNETETLNSIVDLSGLIRGGENTIAVEVHQNTLTSSDVGFFLALVPGSEDQTRGFSYQDDVFEDTNDPDFSNGTYEAAEGFVGGALSVVTGGKGFFSFLNPASSGGWNRTFTVDSAGVYPVSFRYRLLFSGEYEGDEFSQALFELDGVRYGDGPSSSLLQFTGGTGNQQDSGWRLFNREIFLAQGEHTLVLGAYNNKSTQAPEITEAWFDEVRVGSPPRPEPVCGPDSSITGDQVLTFSNGRLSPGESCSFDVGIQIPLSAPTGSYLNQTSLVSVRAGSQGLVGFPATEMLSVETIAPLFEAVFAPADLLLGGTGTLTFLVDNRASLLEAADLDFAAALPEGVELSATTSPTTSCGGILTAEPGTRSVSLLGGLVAPGEVCEVRVGVSGVEAGDFVLSGVTLSSSLGESETQDVEVSVIPPPQFSLSFFPGEVSAGASARLIYTIDNSASNQPVGNLRFDQILPEGLRLAFPADPVTDCIGGIFTAVPGSNTFSYRGGSVPAGGVCSVSVNVSADEGGDYAVRSEDLLSLAGNSGPAEGNLTVSSLVSVGLSVTESSPAVVAGSGNGNLSYVVTATNDGPSRATSIEVDLNQTLPSEVTLGAVTPASGTVANNRWSLPELGAGQSASLTLSLTVGSAAVPGDDVISNEATLVSVDQTDADSSDDVALEQTAISNVFDLALAVSESIDPAIAGSGPGNLEYVLTASNAGPSNATGVSIATLLDLPEGVTLDRVETSNGEFLAGPGPGGSWNLGLPVGATESLTVVLSVGATAPDEGLIQLTGSVSEANGVDPAAGNDQTSAETRILGAVDLGLTFLGSRDPVLAGFQLPGNLFHTLTVSNKGPSDASGVKIDLNQTFPEGVVIDGTTLDSGTSLVGSVWSVGDLAAGESVSLITYFGVPGTVAGGENLVSSTASISEANETLLLPADDQAAVTTDIASPADTSIAPGAIELDLQTGLFKQKVTVTNDNPVAVPAFRVLVTGLADGTSLHNAQGAIEGIPYFDVNQPLEAGESIDLTMEYLQLDATGGLEPTFEVQFLDTLEEVAAGEGVAVDRCEVLATGDILIEFSAVIGATYAIQYSDDGETWNEVLPQVVSGGTRQQWIDNGPPKTSSPPGETKSRLYRVLRMGAGN